MKEVSFSFLAGVVFAFLILAIFLESSQVTLMTSDGDRKIKKCLLSKECERLLVLSLSDRWKVVSYRKSAPLRDYLRNIGTDMRTFTFKATFICYNDNDTAAVSERFGYHCDGRPMPNEKEL